MVTEVTLHSLDVQRKKNQWPPDCQSLINFPVCPPSKSRSDDYSPRDTDTEGCPSQGRHVARTMTSCSHDSGVTQQTIVHPGMNLISYWTLNSINWEVLWYQVFGYTCIRILLFPIQLFCIRFSSWYFSSFIHPTPAPFMSFPTLPTPLFFLIPPPTTTICL